MTRHAWLLLSWLLLASLPARGEKVIEVAPGEAVERHLPGDGAFTQWARDPELLATEAGDRLEQREVVGAEAEIVKLRNVVPPIRFESGVAAISPSYVERLRGVLDSMRHLENVRLHLVGHADDQPLSPGLAGIYGDNAGLSRERAGEVAEFLKTALALPADAISFEWAGDSQPIASNATPAGRARNRRVEVEVWYDELHSKVGVEEVVVPEEIKRVKVCRMETVCKLRYREGHAHRARVRNLVAPLHFGDETVGVPGEFVEQIAEALHNLRDQQGVAVKFIGHTDDVPLAGREERIYGTHLALSKARAHRVALAVREALELPTAAIASDGRGAAQPLASNETRRGRALNRRVEVEFWYDDPLQELPDEPQPCPDAAAAEVVTKVYEPPWGRIPALELEAGEAVIPPGYTDVLRRAMAEVADETNVRLRFVGYTRNERLDRRTALVYGDDIGLSAARARRAMERIRQELGLSESQAEHEGHGYVHSEDVVNAGFIQGETSHVVVQVVYDELAALGDLEGVDVTPITRELRAQDPLALNLMRISVDGVPIDDPGRSSADIQRCTDVALEAADIRFRFDDLELTPRLAVSADPGSVVLRPTADGGLRAADVRFRMYTNYPHYIERSEVRIFERGQSAQAQPLAVLEIGADDEAAWQPPAESFAGPRRELQYVLRAYDAEGRFDETAPLPLWMIHGAPLGPREVEPEAPADAEDRAPAPGARPGREALLAGYGESALAFRNIPLGSAGTVGVHGSGIPPQHTVWLAGEPVPVDEQGSFVAETILPSGMHTVEVAVLDEAGNGELFLRDLEFGRSDWFYVGVADVTLALNETSGPIGALTGKDAPQDPESWADGRLAFYVNGQFGENWQLKASADTREASVQDMFSNFLDKSPESLFRRMDPDYHYPTFGDDGTVEETAPTLGKFFVKLEKDESHALWGNFKVGYLDNELAHVDRGLYGANLRYQSRGTTGFGEKRLVLDGFAAQPGTVPSREEFRSTGGSLYFLRRQDLLVGSERVRVEVRDKDSGLVTSVVHLQPTQDYDIDYLQGRLLLSEPIASTVEDRLVVRSGSLSGDEAWLVVQYEYTPGFDEVDALAAGGQGQYWFNDSIKLGLTASRNEDGGSDSGLYGADLTVRKSSESWFKLQAGRSEGLVSTSLRSDDGGFRFFGDEALAPTDADAGAYRADLSLGFGDFFDGGRGRLSLYAQMLDAGYSAPGLTALSDTQQYGGSFQLPVLDRIQLAAKADRRVEEQGLTISAQEVDVGYRLSERWSLSSGVRNEMREDDSPVVPLTQEEGERTDAAVQLAYDSRSRWRGYGFAQHTLWTRGDMQDNRRVGVGGAYRVSDRLLLDAEVSHGDLGPGGRLGTSYQQSESTNVYLNYTLGNERIDGGLDARRGNLIHGARTRLSDSSSVYLENRYQHSDSVNGLTKTIGMSLAPTDRWTLGANWESGILVDARTDAETNRRAGGAHLGYRFRTLQLSSGVEYRFDETEHLDGTFSERMTWLFRNSLRFQMSPDWRLVGKLNHAFSDSSLGQFYDGGYTEAVLGYAYRPVKHDRLHTLAKYTYFYNVPTTDQLTLEGTAAEFIQKSHIASLDLTYDVTSFWSLGGKYAYRLGQVSLDREDPEFFDNSAHLFILRNDLRFLKHWEAVAEARMLDLTDLSERRSGALIGLYRYLGDHFKVGVGYNFTDFSEDLTDLSYDHHGVFFNMVGTL
jgi:flagellar motor protein MotB